MDIKEEIERPLNNVQGRETYQGSIALKGFSLQEAYAQIGGMGKFHIFACAMMISAFASGQFITQLLQFLELQPKYRCSFSSDFSNPFLCAPWKSANIKGFCGTDLYYEVNWNDEASLHNWFEELNLTCVPKERIGFIGSSLFIGWALSATFLPRLSDLFGRRRVFIASMGFQVLTFIGLYLSKNIDLTTVIMFLFGMASVGRTSLSFLYMMELLPANRQVLCGTTLQLFNASVSIIGSVYFWKISKNWLWLEVFGGCLALISMLGAVFMPESPKYLLTKGRYEEARTAINRIAAINRQKPFEGQFDREITEMMRQKSTEISLKMLDEERIMEVQEEQQFDGSIRDLVKVRKHLINLMIFIYIWTASSFDMYLVTYSMKYIPGNIFKNMLTSALLDLPFALLGGYAFHKLGVRTALTVAFICAMIGSVTIALLSKEYPDFVHIMFSLARGGVKVSFDICYLANSTIFPAIFAGAAFGLCNMGAKVATILSPMLAEVPPPVPMIIFTSVALVATVLSTLIRTEKHSKKLDSK